MALNVDWNSENPTFKSCNLSRATIKFQDTGCNQATSRKPLATWEPVHWAWTSSWGVTGLDSLCSHTGLKDTEEDLVLCR